MLSQCGTATKPALIALLALSWAVQAGAAPITTFGAAFHFRWNIGPNSVGLPSGDQQFVGILNVSPTAGTSVTPMQGAVTRPLSFTPFTVFPTMFRSIEPFDLSLTGSWSITAINGPDAAGPVLTPSIPNPQLLPFAQNLQVVGAGSTPTVTWSLPDLTGFDVDYLRFRVYDDASNDAILNLVLPLATTSFAIPSGLLISGVPYVFSVNLNDGDENVSTAFTQSGYSVPEPGTAALLGVGLVGLAASRSRGGGVSKRREGAEATTGHEGRRSMIGRVSTKTVTGIGRRREVRQIMISEASKGTIHVALQSRARASIWMLWALVLGLANLATPAAAVPDPIVTGPIAATAPPGDPSHDYIFFASLLDLSAWGYVEEEYFISGTANRYNTPGTSTGTILDSNHPYKTRIVVRRPASADDFNGVVVVEWLNVTNGLDMENTWFQIDEHLLRSGYAWVGVSAQRDGVNRLRTWSPGRYGTLDVSQRNGLGVETITNDALSYDVFSQAAQAVQSPVGIDPLGSLEPQVVIATGHSQSALRLVTYVNAIQPLSHAFDAFALHGSLGNVVRVDLEVPVWKVLSEYDVSGFNEAQVRRPDDGFFRTWEVAGTSHNDRKSYASRVLLQLRDTSPPVEDPLSCGVMPPGSAVPFHYVMAAGLEHLVHWVREGTPMPSAQLLETISIFPPVLARDGFGNALGGIRLSQMDVPTAVHNGTNSGPGACPRWGYTLPFDAQTLATLYPSHEGYVSQVIDVTDQALLDGFILAPDAEQTIEYAIALPEPEQAASLWAGCLLLGVLARRRVAQRSDFIRGTHV